MITALTGILFILAAAVTGAQPQRCDLGSPHRGIGSDRDTLDMPGVQGRTIAVPASVTRFPRDAFGFLKGNSTVDIVYVLDHSTSMGVDGYWENADRSIVRYVRESSQLIASGYFTNCGSLQIPYGGGLSRKDLVKLCGAYNPILDQVSSGDPFGSSSYAVREAIGHQAKLSSQSRAGYLPFSVSDMAYAQQSLVMLDSSSNLNRLLDKIDVSRNDFVGTTDYTEPLKLAAQWLQGSGNPVIFFVTDLRPTENGFDELAAFMEGYPIPVYGVFTGLTEPTAVKDLFIKTGGGKGSFYHISPDQSDSLKIILTQFVGKLLAWRINSMTIENSTLRQVATAGGTGAVVSNGITFPVTDSVVALKEGINSVKVRVEFVSSTGSNEVRQTSFNVDVGAISEGGFEETKAKLGLYCGLPSTITIVNALDVPVATIDKSGNIRLKLNIHESAGLTNTNIVITTASDREVIPVTLTAQSGRLIGSAVVSLNIGSNASVGNGSIETNAVDEIQVRWVHPRDARDTAVASAIVTSGLSLRITGAAYVDGRGDSANGTPDTILCRLDPTSVLNYLQKYPAIDVGLLNRNKNLITLGGSLAGITVDSIFLLGDDQLRLVLRPNTTMPTGDQSMRINAPNPFQDGLLSWPSTGVVSDGIGPVVKGPVIYKLSDDPDGQDTLSVTFSEPVECASGTPFTLSNDGKTRYGLVLTKISETGATVQYLVTGSPYGQYGSVIVAGDQFPEEGDLLSIHPAAGMSDGLTEQSYERNRTVPVHVTGALHWKVMAIVPFTPGKTYQSPWGPVRGIPIIVTSTSKVGIFSGIRARIDIYDPVGNAVVSGVAMTSGNSNLKYVWEGKNSSGRSVGTGSYLAVITIVNGEGKVERKRLLIGVTR